MHLNILAHFSEICREEENKEYESTVKAIMLNIKSYYRKTPSNKKRLEDFRKKKTYEVDIHEVITRIGANITKYHKMSFSLLDSYFFDDIIDYLKLIKSSKDIVKEVIEKKKRDSEEIKKFILSITENSALIFLNIMSSTEDEVSDLMTAILVDHDIEDADQLFALISECKDRLNKYGCKTTKLEQCLKDLKSCFEMDME